MLATLLASLVLQGAVESVHPPKGLGMLALSVRPVGVWKVKDRSNPGAVMLVAPPKGTLAFSGNETKMKPVYLQPETIVKVNGLTWHVNTRENVFKVTVLSATAVAPGKEYRAVGNMTGGVRGKMMKDALATLKTFKAM